MSKLINKISKRMGNVKPDAILSFGASISDVDGLIPLTIGEPDFNTPDHIKEAAIKAINDNQSHYSDSRGIIELREAAVNFLADKYGLNYDADTEFIATVGVTEAVFLTFAAILDTGDGVIIPSPAFSPYFNNVAFFGAHPIEVDTSKDDFVLTPYKLEEAIRQHPEVKAVIINTPNNPTGVSYTREQLKELADVIKKYDIFCISDEIYSELNYEHEHASIAEFIRDQTIVYNGLSKSHAMTGWRVGLVYGPADIINVIKSIHEYNVSSITDNAQFAAAEALNHGRDDGPEMKKIYEKRRALLRQGLSDIGIESANPSGAFYIFAKIPEQFGEDDFAFCTKLAKEAKVGTMPGSAFGKAGKGYFRLSYATSEDNLNEALKHIAKFVEDN
ncbi:aminotransferase class I/II-fold pyridoxal phosphate-dependent enzyme [Apilactobacillus kunkeei]|uniref:aminotransferase class I/II-fold pyridoxal phosphate-dependent enzyme n=1 Tax=Apilactobacillus kunkeei TaxID=148814 RepID=UPI00200A9789|nr:aminotransferase class I/II-fold pyridoxal phosphate-dependent enzyme [Apilactobacillus kunkeei]MCK8625692.1 aminotransferase class I/II-fold pyridoxal phosphate-dependent enzyme [Apilactobacillus kunkeei]